MNARGSASVLLIGCIALGSAFAMALIPVAHVLVAVRRAQSAADAAALAGADELALGGSCAQARTAADAFADRNRATLVEVTCTGRAVAVAVRVDGPHSATRRARAIVDPCVRCGPTTEVPAG